VEKTGLSKPIKDISNYEVLHAQKEEYKNILNEIRQYNENDDTATLFRTLLTEFKTIFTKQSSQLIPLIDALGTDDIYCTEQNDEDISKEF